ncbi:MAG: nucleoside-diphosphate kinase [Candidatus Margulisbacteria bacterium]|nr:nucleoside-diphosphate kinase [Candidatus Margulisiibacteriota bacterium]
MIKPDGVSRGLADEVLVRVKKAGLKLIRQKELTMTKELAADLYSPHLGKRFYPGLVKFITSGPVTCCVVEGEDAIGRLRELMGATDPRKALPGTIRGDLKEANVLNPDGIIKNLVHGSDSPASAKREIPIFFKGED